MNAYTYIAPGCTLFGYGAIQALKEELLWRGCRKALIVTDTALIQLGVVKKVTDAIADEIAFCIYDGVIPNPTHEVIYRGTAIAKRENVDFVLSIGGGSAHDSAKAIALLVTNGGLLEDYENVTVSEKAPLPIVAVTTTAGTGSECTMDFVVVEEAKHRKYGLCNRQTVPTVAVVDHSLMMKLPAHLTAGPGMDALTHAIESYVSKDGWLLTRELALTAIRLIYRSLKQAVTQPDEENREMMAAAQYIAGLSFGNAGCGLAHSMSHALSGLYQLPHGLCNGIVLAEASRLNCKSADATARYAQIADVVFPFDVVSLTTEEKAVWLIDQIEALSEAVGTKRHLKELNGKEADLPLLVEKTMADACLRHNLYQPSREEVFLLFQKVM